MIPLIQSYSSELDLYVLRFGDTLLICFKTPGTFEVPPPLPFWGCGLIFVIAFKLFVDP